MSTTSNRVNNGHLASVSEQSVFRKVNRRLLPILLLCYTFAYLDRVNIGFAKLHMQEDVPLLTEAVFGIGAGLFFLAYACLEIPSNLLMHKVGARRTITRIMILWGLTSSSMMFVRDETSFYILRILLGIFEAGFAPGIILYLTYWYPARRMAAVMGIYMLAGPIGSILGSGVSAAIIAATDNLGGLAGWQWMFVIQGLPCVLLGYIFWKSMADRPADAHWLTDQEKSVVAKAIDETAAGQTTHKFIDALREPSVYVMAAAYFGIMCGIYAVSFWLPTILKDNGVQSTFVIGMLTAIPYILTIPAMILLSRSSDRHQERKWHAVVPSLVAAAGLTVAAFTASNFVLSFVALCIAVCAVWGAYTVFWAVPSHHFGGTAAVGGIAFINTIGILGGFVAPTIMGFVREATGSTQGGLLTMVGLLFMSVAALLFLPTVLRNRKIEVAP
ncbi:MFS transporter [Paeniglutamicibacter sp. ABSL32-1]|uniref:MFS transporter n=1 Tax=Paeniglutamicibacter quisquiliarum TaxID=2849498 RepID=UPI001C2DD18D|nr:MFS transporter [Paeniglutamicibacter quisquiliarum]MBV1777602.1 MFS transporter [Paeniglutamicibacter quisquiliarum]